MQNSLNLTYDYGDYSLSYENNYNMPDYALVNILFVANYSSSPDNYLLTLNMFKRTLINDLNETDLSTMSYNLDSDELISCQFNGNSCTESSWGFSKILKNIYGNCYTVNSDKHFYLTGNHYGLHLEMTVSKYKKL